jgi:hypothetical protein
MSRVLLRSVLAFVAATATIPSWAANPSLVFKLDGQPVTAVPIDHLARLTVTVNTGGPSFKQMFAGQWGGIDQSVDMRTKLYGVGAAQPDPAEQGWKTSPFALTSKDSTWSAKSSLTVPLFQGARDMDFESAGSTSQIAFSACFYRREYTGKTVWVKGGWVPETHWPRLGPVLGLTTLKLLPPLAAKALKPADVARGADTAYADKAEDFSKFLMGVDSTGGTTVTHKGSRILGVEVAANPKVYYRWGWKGRNDYTYAEIPVTMKLHTAMQVKTHALPAPSTVEADFTMPAVLSAGCPFGASTWTAYDLSVTEDGYKQARTADGKSAEDVAKGATIDPLRALQTDPNASMEEKAQSLIKGLGL